MRKIAVILLLFISTNIFAQWTAENSASRFAPCVWTLGEDGLYHQQNDVSLSEVNNIVEVLGYNKVTRNLYVLTENAVVFVTLNETDAKEYKKKKDIKLAESEEAEAWFEFNKKLLAKKFQQMNADIEKQRTDSIDKVIAIAEALKMENYKKSHDWHWVPCAFPRYKGSAPKPSTLYCKECDNSFEVDSVFSMGIKENTIYFVAPANIGLALEKLLMHQATIPIGLLHSDAFKYHIEAYKDSLYERELDPEQFMAYYNAHAYSDGFDKIKEYAPYGYFSTWGWNSKYGNITFNFSFNNTNKKTIKYIEVFFVVKNDVGDVRKTGSFKGTGPVEEFQIGRWNWDSSSYYVAGDATRMDLTKAIITYMDMSQKVLSKNQLVFE